LSKKINTHYQQNTAYTLFTIPEGIAIVIFAPNTAPISNPMQPEWHNRYSTLRHCSIKEHPVTNRSINAPRDVPAAFSDHNVEI